MMFFNIYDSSAKFKTTYFCQSVEGAIQFGKDCGINAPMVQETDQRGNLIYPKPVNLREHYGEMD